MGSPGSVSGLLLRILQCILAAGSVGVMVSAHGFFNFTAYWYISFLSVLSFPSRIYIFTGAF